MVRVVRVSLEEGMSLPRELWERSWVDAGERPLAAKEGEALWPRGRRGRGRPRKKVRATAVDPNENPGATDHTPPGRDASNAEGTPRDGTPADRWEREVKTVVVDPLAGDRVTVDQRLSTETSPQASDPIPVSDLPEA
ncbi:MAG TPA: hypothetical protein DDY91_06445 [Planctomycetaceae bacterium]|nr:hypothetical protein [Planctomycetaceae bacterium]